MLLRRIPVGANPSALLRSAAPFAKGSCIFLASSGAAFNMYGGAIAGNMAKRDITTDGYSKDAATYGGGVYVGSGAKFTMSGGKISKNTASQYGGGVYIEFEDLTNEGGTFTMSGGTIGGSQDEGNSAQNGGGVYVAGGTFEMSGTAAISNNTATTFGGGVYVGSNATFTMTGGTIGSSADVVDENDIQG